MNFSAMASVIDQIKVKAGRLIRVFNKKPAPNAKAQYVSVWVEDADGCNERCLLFTEHEIKKAEERASKNIEDLTKKSFFTDLFD
jgi:hypothetical protein